MFCKRFSILFSIVTCIFFVNQPEASGIPLTIIHTNDLHSHFLGFSPNRDYSPLQVGDDKTLGGWARIKTVINRVKKERQNPVLVLDAGDFLMGSLFHMVSREEGLELRLMKKMGYDVITFGNHEFDLNPKGLSRILRSAIMKDGLPSIVASNIVFSDSDQRDDDLQKIFQEGYVKPYLVMEKEGVKIGFFGLVGEDAESVAPFASPVKFSDMIVTAKKMVKKLREIEKVDMVICLSHSGLSKDVEKSEDVILAQQVPGINIIISGHTHTKMKEPLVVDNTIIVQSWAYGQNVGVLDVDFKEHQVKLSKYKVITVDDTIPGDIEINDQIESYKQMINQQVLSKYNYQFDQVLVETDFDLRIKEDESNLGNLITDATRWAADKQEYDKSDPLSRVMITVQSNGVIRDHLLKGKTGLVTVSDLFRTVPLGIGSDGSMSYPLVAFYINAAEIKKAMEVLTTIYPLKGSDYFLQYSGVKMTYNPNRMLFDRVTEIQIQNEDGTYVPLNTSESNPRLYKIVSNIYNSTFLKIIGQFTSGILTIVPKYRSGQPIEDFNDVLIDGDKTIPGIQEIKDWTALMDYVQSFPDTDGDGVANMPERYRKSEGRLIVESSLNPYQLLKGGNKITWLAFGALILLIVIGFTVFYFLGKIIRKKRA